jgi:hypothetical protein
MRMKIKILLQDKTMQEGIGKGITCFINLGRNTAIDAFFEGILNEFPGGFAVKSFSYIHSKHFDIVS